MDPMLIQLTEGESLFKKLVCSEHVLNMYSLTFPPVWIP